MMTTWVCQHCSQLPPPPPVFSLGPPPKILSIEIYCSSRLLSSSSIEHKKVHSSSSSSAVPITLAILIGLLLSTGAIVLINSFRNRLIKRRRRRQRTYDHPSLSVKFNGHDDHPNRTNFIPLLSDTYTISTPDPCSIHEPFFPNEISHDYEQIQSENSSANYYCLVYCRQCGNYHQTSRVACTCLCLNENHRLNLQPIYRIEKEVFND